MVETTSKQHKTSVKGAAEKKWPLIGIVRIRGIININKDIRDTLDMLKLHKKNFCVVYEGTPSIMGMIKKVKDYVTWGEVDDETVKLLVEKRQEKNPNDPEKTKKFFRLNSPKKGFGRKGIKASFSQGGAQGNRGQKMNDLIKRMV